ncbi:hypothetical protein TIFTF001_032971 [Ficus carica]|uniref:Uncharacterized protein n=1 Tax=Ficus carica TaxID=3494 RepID=A0AA88DY21_FICCA|nr:hypothetical protein TIFTF001_032971 [Ficus carica]
MMMERKTTNAVIEEQRATKEETAKAINGGLSFKVGSPLSAFTPPGTVDAVAYATDATSTAMIEDDSQVFESHSLASLTISVCSMENVPWGFTLVVVHGEEIRWPGVLDKLYSQTDISPKSMNKRENGGPEPVIVIEQFLFVVLNYELVSFHNRHDTSLSIVSSTFMGNIPLHHDTVFQKFGLSSSACSKSSEIFARSSRSQHRCDLVTLRYSLDLPEGRAVTSPTGSPDHVCRPLRLLLWQRLRPQ